MPNLTAGNLPGTWNAWDESAELPLRTRALLLALVVSTHGLGVSLAMNMRTAPDIVPPGILEVQWIASAPPGPPAGAPEAAPPLPEPPAPAPEPEPPAPEPEPVPEPPPPEPIPEPPIIPEALAEPEAPPVAPPPPSPPPRPPKRPKPPPKPSNPAPAPRPAEAPPAKAAPSSGASPSASSPVAGTAQSGGADRNSEYVEPNYRAAYLSNPPPVYPPASRRMEEEGRVTLRVHITVEGRADDVLLHQGSGFARLDRAAAEAVRHWRFVPARRGRESVPAWVLVPIQFSLGS